MNEQLRKAILEATRVEPWQLPYSIGNGRAVDELEHVQSKAKLLRVIEVLVQQRDDALRGHINRMDERYHDELGLYMQECDAELIAALEGNHE